MNIKSDNYLKFFARSYILLLSGLSAISLFWWLETTALIPSGVPGVIHLQLAFSLSRFNDILQSWGSEAVNQYRHTMWIDYLYAIAYGVFLSGALFRIGLSFQLRKQIIKIFALIPILVTLLDWAENTFHLYLLNHEATRIPVLIVSIIAAFKWWLALQSVLLIVFGLFILLFKKRTKLSG